MRLGVQITLARAPGVAYIGFLCMWTCLALVVLAFIRTRGDLATGLVIGFIFSLVMVQGQLAWPAGQLWGTVRAPVRAFISFTVLSVFPLLLCVHVRIDAALPHNSATDT